MAKELTSLEEAMASCKPADAALCVFYFWKTACDACIRTDPIFDQLCTDVPHARFFRIEALHHPEITAAFQVTAIPGFLFIKDGAVVDKLNGCDPAQLANRVAKLAGPLNWKQCEIAPESIGMAAGAYVLDAVQDKAKHLQEN